MHRSSAPCLSSSSCWTWCSWQAMGFLQSDASGRPGACQVCCGTYRQPHIHAMCSRQAVPAATRSQRRWQVATEQRWAAQEAHVPAGQRAATAALLLLCSILCTVYYYEFSKAGSWRRAVSQSASAPLHTGLLPSCCTNQLEQLHYDRCLCGRCVRLQTPGRAYEASPAVSDSLAATIGSSMPLLAQVSWVSDMLLHCPQASFIQHGQHLPSLD